MEKKYSIGSKTINMKKVTEINSTNRLVFTYHSDLITSRHSVTVAEIATGFPGETAQ